jgi:thiol:disulfide interchange protein DsbC
MFLPILLSFLLLFSVLPIGYSYGFEGRGQECSKCHTLSKEEAKELLKNLIPNVVILDVQLSPAKGFWEVYVESMSRKGLVYVDFPKKHFFSGALISIAEKKNLTQDRLTNLNRIDVSQIPLQDALVMGDQNAKIRVILFTDPDCTYCARLHQEMKKIIEERKEVAFHIKMFPLVKIHPEAYEKAKAIACEKSLTLLEDAYGGKPLPKPKCETTVVDENIRLAEKLGISSLPALVFPDGRVISGYKDAKTLITLIDK